MAMQAAKRRDAAKVEGVWQSRLAAGGKQKKARE